MRQDPKYRFALPCAFAPCYNQFPYQDWSTVCRRFPHAISFGVRNPAYIFIPRQAGAKPVAAGNRARRCTGAAFAASAVCGRKFSRLRNLVSLAFRHSGRTSGAGNQRSRRSPERVAGQCGHRARGWNHHLRSKRRAGGHEHGAVRAGGLRSCPDANAQHHAHRHPSGGQRQNAAAARAGVAGAAGAATRRAWRVRAARQPASAAWPRCSSAVGASRGRSPAPGRARKQYVH